MTPSICFLDTETDGIHPGRQVWEVAAIRRDPNGTERTLHLYVTLDLSTADPFGLPVGRFYQRHPLGRHLSGGPLPSEPITDLAPFGDRETQHVGPDDPGGWALGAYVTPAVAAASVARFTHGAHLVGAVPSFDADVLAAMLRRQQLTPAWHYHLIDVETLAVGWLEGHAAAARMEVDLSVVSGITLPWKSDDLSRAVGVEPPTAEERHTALGDARWAMRLYDAVTSNTP